VGNGAIAAVPLRPAPARPALLLTRRGAQALFTIELDRFLGDKPVQVRRRRLLRGAAERACQRGA